MFVIGFRMSSRTIYGMSSPENGTVTFTIFRGKAENPASSSCRAVMGNEVYKPIDQPESNNNDYISDSAFRLNW